MKTIYACFCSFGSGICAAFALLSYVQLRDADAVVLTIGILAFAITAAWLLFTAAENGPR